MAKQHFTDNLQRERSRSPRRGRSRSPGRSGNRRSYSPRSNRSRSADRNNRRRSRSPMNQQGQLAGGSNSGYGGAPRSNEDRVQARDNMMSNLRENSQQDRRVYVGNLSYDVKWHHLKDFMRQGMSPRLNFQVCPANLHVHSCTAQPARSFLQMCYFSPTECRRWASNRGPFLVPWPLFSLSDPRTA